MSMRYFAYGSNLHPLRFRRRVPSGRRFAVGLLEGFELRFHKRGRDASGKCNAFENGNNGNRLHGVVYEMDPEHKELLDRVEGLGRGYVEERVEVQTEHGRIECYTYIAQHEYRDDSLQPYPWYKRYVLEGGLYHGLDDFHLKIVEEIATVEDPDPRRAQQHLEVLESLYRSEE